MEYILIYSPKCLRREKVSEKLIIEGTSIQQKVVNPPKSIFWRVFKPWRNNKEKGDGVIKKLHYTIQNYMH